ncbi:GDSL esterase/lipase [Rhynchospora pubera]|uniref:GDSL esterase/lipase n=1 Tax=Rhynchospora pubera TaxID=906938 RepID=A0AAV8EFU5_9POAL|nr:GDSL esterase/lipase [Rhynchospora pubera]
MAPFLLGLFFSLLLFSSGEAIATTSPTAAPTAAPPLSASRLFVLGDSTANCRDNSRYATLLWLNFSLPSCSNRLFSDLIAEKMGLVRPPPYYTLQGSSSVGTSMWNFGTPQGTILSSTNSFSPSTLSRQVRHVAEVIQILQLGYGAISSRQMVSSALFLLSFGTDDYLRILRRQSEISSNPKYQRHKLGPLLVSHMVRAVKDLYNADARRIAVVGVGPIGCAPSYLQDRSSKFDSQHCVGEVNDLIAGYNAKLETRLERLRSELPDAEIVFCDVYKGILDIISNPKIYGFENVRDPCCSVGPLSSAPCKTACVEPHRHVWWDSYSNTEVVNSLLADWSWSNSSGTTICRPKPLQYLTGNELKL